MVTKADILVTGDFVIDHHLLKGNKSEAFGTGSIGTRLSATYGGAKLTYDLASNFVNKINSENNVKNGKCFWPFSRMPESGSSEGTNHDSYLRWEILGTGGKKAGENKFFCKLYEKLGFGGQRAPAEAGWLKTDMKINSRSYKFIIIDEAGIGFRNHKESWPDFSKAEKIILKTTFPLCESLLWNELAGQRQKLITIVNLDQIKHYNVRVSNGISWEQTALDTVYGVHQDPVLKNLLKSAELIITIGTAGAVIITAGKTPGDFEYRLVFDPENMEEEWEEKYSGDIINQVGLGSSFLAGFATSLCLRSLRTQDSVKVGLNSMVAAMIKGIFELNDNFSLKPKDLSSALDEHYNKRYYSSAFIPSPAWIDGLAYVHNQEWSILENNYENRKKDYKPKSDLYPLAFSLALDGIETLHFAPRLSMGKAIVFDRSEIENLRNLRKLIEFYDKYEDGRKPLNIAVFGPPGAGKSFIIKALAANLFKNKKTTPSFLTINLSQFKDESELPGAFHAIRDEVLRGRLPVVFWDEFDSDDYRWLKSFIAPMQDGTFQEGKETHPIGKSIFVFAGGMTYTMAHFSKSLEADNLISKKGPDFLSRISGYLNVFGPNRKPWFDDNSGHWCKEGDQSDNCFSIRRALFIRYVLGSGNNTLNIDLQLLKTLIEVNYYKNGARGLDRLLTNLSVHSGRKIELSDLPSKEIIQMNIDYDDFMKKLGNQSIREKINFEKLAMSIHNAWLDIKVKDSVYFEEYGDLNYDGRLDNISAAQRIIDVIAMTGKFALILETDRIARMLNEAKNEFDEYISDEKNLEKLAIKEHEGWIITRKNSNWVFGERSDYHKKHPCLIPWHDLDPGITDPQNQAQKNKDRNSIKKYTSMLEGSGYTIISLADKSQN